MDVSGTISLLTGRFIQSTQKPLQNGHRDSSRAVVKLNFQGAEFHRSFFLTQIQHEFRLQSDFDMDTLPEKRQSMSVRKQYALVVLIIALVYIVGGAFFITDGEHEQSLWINIPGIVQISAPECPSRMVTGVPCPICGITTSSMLYFDGDFKGSFEAHPLGPIFATLMILSIPYNLWILISREKKETVGNEERLLKNRKITISILMIVLAAWIVSLLRHFDIISW